MGIEFDIDNTKGPIIQKPIRTMEQVDELYDIDLSRLEFVSSALTHIRAEVGRKSAVLGFIGSPWTLATYIVEGASSQHYRTIKNLSYSNPDILEALLRKLTIALTDYIIFQIDAGAHVVQIFDSWGGHLPPKDWDRWSKPYLRRIIREVHLARPHIPLTVFANGCGGLLERIAATGADIVGVDWATDLRDARHRLDVAAGDADSNTVCLQGNVDPAVLFGPKAAITEAVKDCLVRGGGRRHILNLGHGVQPGTPEDAVAHLFEVSKELGFSANL
eukprot:CAMPEP_0175053260 /NCGR_PEP_ID=MMETSP0052_2-20121109/8822_1 /TAXON_ID=51329 ORGANISM="Polytomella parva, Strain SAG 63-3" /NCGR_SAMPLE_ID=MMETSP0052_2 /ASSEMBLY_ACC=CAM_ASM_000194 /LENGTH=274 /DNA_ID=CAMNT_0016317767 /DNA_START=573 /DNA_END=1397 /DNA_ORIENTATION=-